LAALRLLQELRRAPISISGGDSGDMPALVSASTYDKILSNMNGAKETLVSYSFFFLGGLGFVGVVLVRFFFFLKVEEECFGRQLVEYILIGFCCRLGQKTI
jgi:hypothetical protein